MKHKMALKIFEFYFTSPLHIATVGLEYANSSRQLHSDTLYAAILQMWATLGMDSALAEIEKANGQIPFTLSSLFPFTQYEGKKIRFLPRIFKPFDPTYMRQNVRYMKKFKDIEWMEEDYFFEHIEQKMGTKPQLNHIRGGGYLSKKPINSRFMHGDIMPRVKVSRSNEDAEPFYMERLYFTEGSGFYCLFDGDDIAYQQVKKALSILQEEGIGTDRNIGNGKFTLKESIDLKKWEAVFANTKNAKYFANLSLFNPNETQINDLLKDKERTGYDLCKRGGWITTEPHQTLRKKSLYMFKEGSVFTSSNPLYTAGVSVNVAPDNSLLPSYKHIHHPIWRVGKSFFVPVHF